MNVKKDTPAATIMMGIVYLKFIIFSIAFRLSHLAGVDLLFYPNRRPQNALFV
jgi:hypothetical protein